MPVGIRPCNEKKKNTIYHAVCQDVIMCPIRFSLTTEHE